MRRALFPTALATSVLGALGIVSCVGEEPATSVPTQASDSGTPVLEEDASVNCGPGQPQLFAPVPGTGPFCNGAPGNHCQPGEHCCRDTALNTQICAASCDAGVVDVACLNGAECAGAGAGFVCCAKGVARLDVCTYAVVDEIISTACAPSCSNEFQVCSNNGECNGKTCTPTRALTPDRKATSSLQIGACL